MKEGFKEYHKSQLNPNNGKWYQEGKAVLTEDTVEILNSKSDVTGIKYEEAKPKKTVKKEE